MTIEEQVQRINIELKKDGNFTRAAKEVFGVSESTLRKKFKKSGYKRVDNEYVFIEEEHAEKIGRQTGGRLVSNEECQTIDDLVSVDEIQVLTSSIPKEIKENYNILIEMIEGYKKNKHINTGNIIVELPAEENKEFRVTIRINEIIYKAFNNFCEVNKQFTKKELLSQALKEYIENHK
ncbi:MAG: hypothetical protein ACRC1T_03330 [Clostridium chrysemydis]|uniref:hypothetical protein n=1 Tax=Clostridium chrysemydis TaxID=2665504 RepID=UPI003F3190FA